MMLIFLMLLTISLSRAQVFEVETLMFNGNNDKYLNIIVLGDGYIAEEQSKFITDSKKVIDYLFSIEPWKNYANFFNVYAIKVISEQSGVDHPKTAADCESEPFYKNKPYFGTTYDEGGIHRAIVPKYATTIHRVINQNFSSKYDQIIIMANSSLYGGTGGEFATVTAHSNSAEIVAHEMGHSFAGLADEYEVGDNNYFETHNMTKTANPLLVKWKNWIGIKSVGVNKYGYSGDAALWYKPHHYCKMQRLGSSYCSVCMQAIVEAIHKKVDLIANYTPSSITAISSAEQYLDFNLKELLTPIPNTLKIEWKLDNQIVAEDVDFVTIDQNKLSNGLHNLVVTVTDDSDFLKVDDHQTVHLNTINWVIDKSSLGVDLNSIENRISYSMYPNPTTNSFKIEFDLDKQSEISIGLYTIDGKKIEQIENKEIVSKKFSKMVDIGYLPTGNYLLAFQIKNSTFSKIIVKH